jgi:hypothetical protein
MKTKIVYLIILLVTSAIVLAVGISIGKNKNAPVQKIEMAQVIEEKTVSKEEISENDIKKEVLKTPASKEKMVIKENKAQQNSPNIDSVKVNKISDKEIEKAAECIKVRQKASLLSQQWDNLNLQRSNEILDLYTSLSGKGFSPDQINQMTNSVDSKYTPLINDMRFQTNYLKNTYWQCFN